MNLYIGKFTNGEVKFRTMLIAEDEDRARIVLTDHIRSNCHYFSTDVIMSIMDSIQIAEITTNEEAVLCVESRHLNPETGRANVTTVMALTDIDDDIMDDDEDEDDSSDDIADDYDSPTSAIVMGYHDAISELDHDRRCENVESM